MSETERLEALWAGEFGDSYVKRNTDAGNHRKAFWGRILSEYPAPTALEIGCNLGANLRWIAEKIGPANTFGIDVNQSALEQLHQSLPGVNAILSPARQLPFRDSHFGLVFTMGVLIHQPEQTLPLVMSEIVRCSKRYILCGEYHSDATTEVAYRGQEGALFKRDYGKLYQELFPQLTLRHEGFLGKAEGWDDVTYWIFEKA